MLETLLSKKVLGPVIVIIITFLLIVIINKFIKKIMNLKLGRTDNKRKKTIINLMNNLVKYFLIIIAVLMILNLYDIDTSTLVASLGLVGLIAGLALQDILKDFLSGISIIMENQYGIGDTVTINGFKGEVVSLGIKTTKLKAYTGEVKFIANRNIQEIINHSITNSLAIVDVAVSYEENIEKVEEVLQELSIRLNKEIPDLLDDIQILGIENLASSSVIFRLTVTTKPLKHYDVQRKLLREIKLEFDKNNITIPYDQVVIHNE